MRKSQKNKSNNNDTMLSLLKELPGISKRISTKVGSEFKPVIRILAYGDSYTAGWHDNGNAMTPYAPFLEKQLQELFDNDNNDSREDIRVIVRHRGLSGWTAKDMVQIANKSNIGLGAILDDAQQSISNNKNEGATPVTLVTPVTQDKENHCISVCIIIVGTNDIGMMGQSQESQKDIYDHIINLHNVANQKGVYTISVDIPPTPYPKESTVSINNRLSDLSAENEMRVHVKFPVSSKTELWDSDGLHMTSEGYKHLGTNLAKDIYEALKKWNIVPNKPR